MQIILDRFGSHRPSFGSDDLVPLLPKIAVMASRSVCFSCFFFRKHRRKGLSDHSLIAKLGPENINGPNPRALRP